MKVDDGNISIFLRARNFEFKEFLERKLFPQNASRQALCIQSFCQSEFYYFQYPRFNCGQDPVTNDSLFCNICVTPHLFLYYTVK